MIAVDTSTLIAFLDGLDGDDVELLGQGLANRVIVLPAPVLCEILSWPALDSVLRDTVLELPVLYPDERYWYRTAQTRTRVLAARRRARLADSLIAQCCLDHDLPLLTRDSDFGSFAELVGLRLLPR